MFNFNKEFSTLLDLSILRNEVELSKILVSIKSMHLNRMEMLSNIKDMSINDTTPLLKELLQYLTKDLELYGVIDVIHSILVKKPKMTAPQLVKELRKEVAKFEKQEKNYLEITQGNVKATA